MSKATSAAEIGKGRALYLIVLIYLAAGCAAYLTVLPLRNLHPILIAGIADVAATVVVFLFSAALNNSSVYDPYWSVIPVLIAVYYLAVSLPEEVLPVRQIIVMSAVVFWAVRLTLNWAIYWPGLNHEDWRYEDIRKKSGNLYWVSSFLGIHFFPTVIVFFGCLSLYPALAEGSGGFGGFDIAGIAVVCTALFFETSADITLHRFLKTRKDKKEVCRKGLWKVTRHPNYLGEVLFWWGLFFFGTAAGFSWMILSGPVIVTFLFLFISIPMMERHMKASRSGYEEYRKSTSMFLPLPKSGK